MASALHNLSDYNDSNIPHAGDMQFGIAVADWNAEITHSLFRGCLDTLLKHGAAESQIYTVQVPGAFELPQAARMLIASRKLDAVICLGCVIRGETAHNEYINTAVAHGLTNLSLTSGKPVVYGVLTPDNQQQGLDRAGGKYGNKGIEAAVTALRMAQLARTLTKSEERSIGFASRK